MPSNISNGFFTSFHNYIILYLDLFVKLLFQEQYNFMKGVFYTQKTDRTSCNVHSLSFAILCVVL